MVPNGVGLHPVARPYLNTDAWQCAWRWGDNRQPTICGTLADVPLQRGCSHTMRQVYRSMAACMSARRRRSSPDPLEHGSPPTRFTHAQDCRARGACYMPAKNHAATHAFPRSKGLATARPPRRQPARCVGGD